MQNAIHFKVVLTTVTLYGLQQMIDIQKMERNIPHSQYTTLALYEDFSGLLSDKKEDFSE